MDWRTATSSGLNKRGNLNLRGVGDATGVGVGLQAPQLLSFCEYVSVSAKRRAIRPLKVMQRSRPAGLPRFFFACGVLVVKGIRGVFQSAVLRLNLRSPNGEADYKYCWKQFGDHNSKLEDRTILVKLFPTLKLKRHPDRHAASALEAR